MTHQSGGVKTSPPRRNSSSLNHTQGITVEHEPMSVNKKRKLRHGTRSCWECKRRKIKCVFSSGNTTTCISCQHRRIKCLGQETPEDLSPAKLGNRHMYHRISKIEEFIEKWGFPESSKEPPQRDDRSEEPSFPTPDIVPSIHSPILSTLQTSSNKSEESVDSSSD